MKRLFLCITALLTALLLSSCSVSEMLSSIDSDTISGWLFKVTEVELDEVKTGEEIRESLPAELTDMTVEGTALGCSVSHLAIRSRSTDTTRRTDQVECEVLLEGDGITLRYVCTLNYTYTTNGGWSLDSWSLSDTELELDVTEGVLTRQLEGSSIQELEAELGENTVLYQSTQWDKSSLVCSVSFLVDACNNYIQSQGILVITGTLTPNLSAGLDFSWTVTQDDSGILYGVDLADTTWLVTGTVDTTQVQIALSISETDIQNQTITLSACTGVLESGKSSVTVNSVENTTLSYTVAKNGTITATFKLGSHSWDCCFSTDSQWCRMDSSYVSAMTLQARTVLDATGLRALLDEEVDQDSGESLAYSSSSSGYTYKAADGTLVYELKASYPQFTGTNAASMNTAVLSAVKSFLENPKLSTDQDTLDTLAELSQTEGEELTLPCYSYLDITVAYNQNHYLSLLFTYTSRLTDGTVTYSYSASTYNLYTLEELTDSEIYSGSVVQMGTLLNAYASSALYTDAQVFGYLQAWTLSRNGLVFYILKNQESGLCESITVPYSEELILFSPTE